MPVIAASYSPRKSSLQHILPLGSFKRWRRNLEHLKLSLVLKPLPICQPTLSGGATIHLQWLRAHTRYSSKFSIFCAISKQKGRRHCRRLLLLLFFLGGVSVKHALSNVVYAGMVVLKEEGPNDIFIQLDSGPPYFHTTVQTSWHKQPSHLGTSHTWFYTIWFLLLGVQRHALYVPTLPTTMLELPWRKHAATSRVTSTTLKDMWTDLEYTHDTCQDTYDASNVKCKLLSTGHISYII